MKRFAPLVYLVAALVVLWAWQRDTKRAAVAEEQARVAQVHADSTAAVAAQAVLDAEKEREGREALARERDAARRQASASQTALHGVLAQAEAAAADSSVHADSLRALIVALGVKVRADSVARAKADSIADAERLRLYRIIHADSLAIGALRKALADEQVAHALTRTIPKRSFISQAGKYAAVASVFWLAGKAGVP